VPFPEEEVPSIAIIGMGLLFILFIIMENILKLK
jgi:hypothetical protein